MTVANRIFQFFFRQIDDIREAKTRAFFRKAKKACRLISMYLFAPPAVLLKIKWPAAYYFVGNKLLRKLNRPRLSLCTDEILIKNIEDRIISKFELYLSLAKNEAEISNWMTASIRLIFLFFYNQGDVKKYINACQRVTEFRVDLMQKYRELEKVGIAFIPIGIPTGSVGGYENLDAFIKAETLGLCPRKKLYLLLDRNARINNQAYLDYWKQYVTIVSDPNIIQMLTPLEKFLSLPIRDLMTLDGKTMITHLALGQIQEKWDRGMHPPLLKLSDEHNKRGWQSLRSLGVPEDAWFVCLHVREPLQRDGSVLTEKFRNADIRSYFSAIEAITSAGGWVIRMGDPISMTPLPAMKQVIDYAHSHVKSDWMDVFLCAGCRFIVGTSSGLFTISTAFGVPAVLTNFLPAFAMYCLSQRDIFIPRLCRFKDGDQELTFKELLSPPTSTAVIQHSYDRLGIVAEENTSEEIRDLIIEMLARFEGKLVYTQEDQLLQKRFRSLSASCGPLHGDANLIVNARLGQNFLRKYAYLLPEAHGLEEPRIVEELSRLS